MSIISSPQQEYAPYQDLATSKDNNNSSGRQSGSHLDADNGLARGYTCVEQNYQQLSDDCDQQQGKKKHRKKRQKIEQIISKEDSRLFVGGGDPRVAGLDGRLQVSSMSSVTIADDWLTSIENSFVKLMLRPDEFLVSQFQSMDGINSPLPESIQQCKSGDINHKKYKINSKSNRYNT